MCSSYWPRVPPTNLHLTSWVMFPDLSALALVVGTPDSAVLITSMFQLMSVVRLWSMSRQEPVSPVLGPDALDLCQLVEGGGSVGGPVKLGLLGDMGAFALSSGVRPPPWKKWCRSL